MTKLLSDIFDEIGLPKYRQGSLLKDSNTPSTFFTYWNLDTPYDDYGDNSNHTKVHQYYVYCYSNKRQEHDKLCEFIKLATSKGWKSNGDGQDIPCDYKNYIGRMVRIEYKENVI